jgi:two-component system, OmpR family, response regulator ChvI
LEKDDAKVVPKRILVIDDEPDITISVKRGLERFHFLVDAFNNPVEAVSKFEPGKFQFAVIDVKMPEMNGFEVYNELLKQDQRLKVCFLTAYEEFRGDFRKKFPDLSMECFL